jgi:hypothetical protein
MGAALIAVALADLLNHWLLILAAVFGLMFLSIGQVLRNDALRMDVEADRLEAEHQARYGAVPTGLE